MTCILIEYHLSPGGYVVRLHIFCLFPVNMKTTMHKWYTVTFKYMLDQGPILTGHSKIYALQNNYWEKSKMGQIIVQQRLCHLLFYLRKYMRKTLSKGVIAEISGKQFFIWTYIESFSSQPTRSLNNACDWPFQRCQSSRFLRESPGKTRHFQLSRTSIISPAF